MSAFDSYRLTAWPHEYKVRLHVGTLIGGVPTNEKVAEGWLKSKLADRDDLIREMTAEVMVDRGVNGAEAVAIVDELQHLNGFRRDPERGLFIEGRQVKAALKEACSVAVAADKLSAKGWGKTNKGILSFIAEHIVVKEDRIFLGRFEADDVIQRFVHTWRGNAIQYEEFVTDVDIEFTLLTDWNFDEKFWAMVLLTGEQQGIGASRSQGAGRYTVEEFEKVR